MFLCAELIAHLPEDEDLWHPRLEGQHHPLLFQGHTDESGVRNKDTLDSVNECKMVMQIIRKMLVRKITLHGECLQSSERACLHANVYTIPLTF